MKTAVLLVSFGTSHKDAGENSLERICSDLKGMNKDIPVYQAYTSGMIIKKLSLCGIKIDTVEEAINRALDENVKCLYVLVTHMISGIEYKKVTCILEKYKNRFEKLSLADSVLSKEEDCDRLVQVLKDIIGFCDENEYILMGHGTEDEANIRYEQMNEAFIRAGFDNVRIASVEAKPDLEDAVAELKKKENVKKVILHPFMVVAGDHAKNDMAGEEDSYLTRLLEEGYDTEAVVKGLGEYTEFRKLYMERLKHIMSGVLYGVGVGPGDPELMTLKAVNAVKECDIIGIPAKSADTCTAYRIALGAVPEIADKPVISVEIPMTDDKICLAKAYDEGSRKLITLLETGKNIAFLNLGDPTIYGTYMRFHKRVTEAGYEAQIISGVPSFCASAAELGISLGENDEDIHIIPAFHNLKDVLYYDGTRILMKSAKKLGEVKNELIHMEKKGEIKAYAAARCGMENQAIYRDINSLDENSGYFTTIIVKDKKGGNVNE